MPPSRLTRPSEALKALGSGATTHGGRMHLACFLSLPEAGVARGPDTPPRTGLLWARGLQTLPVKFSSKYLGSAGMWFLWQRPGAGHGGMEAATDSARASVYGQEPGARLAQRPVWPGALGSSIGSELSQNVCTKRGEKGPDSNG